MNKKEIKVTLIRSENDDYNELWKVIIPVKGQPIYYARHMYKNAGTWYYVADPLGYCELDRPVPEEYVFICCDEKGNECVRYSNADSNPLPKFSDVMKEEWEKISKHIPHKQEDFQKNFWTEALYGETSLNLNKWLITFMDRDLYAKEIDEMYGYEDNWTGSCHRKEISYESVSGSQFIYLGRKYQFTKVGKRHKVCGAEWSEFVCTDSPYIVGKEYGIQYYGYMGNDFDPSVSGKCLDEGTAIRTVMTALEKIYGVKNVIKLNSAYDTRTLGLYDAAKILIGSDNHKHHILSIIEEEKQAPSFIPNTNEGRDRIKSMKLDIPSYIWFNLEYSA